MLFRSNCLVTEKLFCDTKRVTCSQVQSVLYYLTPIYGCLVRCASVTFAYPVAGELGYISRRQLQPTSVPTYSLPPYPSCASDMASDASDDPSDFCPRPYSKDPTIEPPLQFDCATMHIAVEGPDFSRLTYADVLKVTNSNLISPDGCSLMLDIDIGRRSASQY